MENKKVYNFVRKKEINSKDKYKSFNWINDLKRIQNENRSYLFFEKNIIDDNEINIINVSNRGSFYYKKYGKKKYYDR